MPDVGAALIGRVGNERPPYSNCSISALNPGSIAPALPTTNMTTDPVPKPLLDATTRHLPRAAWKASPRVQRVRTHLGEADARLAAAWGHLETKPYDHVAVLDEVLASFRASLLAFLNDFGVRPASEDTLVTLGERTMRVSGVLFTAVNRALVLNERAPAIQQAVRPSVQDREVVEMGCFTARNLVQAVRTVLPAALAGRAASPTSAATQE